MKLKDLIIKNPISSVEGAWVGTIYLFVNKTNKKVYVGKTVNTYTSRFNEHKYNAFTKEIRTYFYNALRKYSWEGFSRFVIFQTEPYISKTDVDSIIMEKEEYFIKLFKSFDHNFGYNLTSGGDGIAGYRFSEESRKLMSESRTGDKHWNYGKRGSASKTVLQFDLDFNLIKEWTSAAEVARELGFKANNISRCCNNNIDTYQGFIWVKKEDYYDGYLQKYKSRAKCKSNDKAVLQYTFLGDLVTEYISAAEAARTLQCDGSSITGAASGKFPQAKGFLWIYKKDLSESLLTEKLEVVKKCVSYKKVISQYNGY